MSNFNSSSDSGMFSFGVRELRIARAAQEPKAERKKERRAEPRLLNAAKQRPGVDPYNTSGSFDSTKSWARVRKR